jgi:hypothetical protein
MDSLVLFLLMSVIPIHTPVDVNGMTIHQWNYGNTSNIDGDNNPARFNVNANEEYYALVINNSANC